MFEKMDGFKPKNCMSGYDFELWVQSILTTLKFDAKRTKGNDNGVDIIATLDERGNQLKYYIQCKFHNRPVGKTPVQEVYTGCNYFGNDGYPVVITNNRMSSETKAYAKQIGVELITEYQLNELSLLLKTGKIVNENYTGLMGIILGKLTRRLDLFEKAVKAYNKEPIKNVETTDKEKLKNELINTFDQVDLLLQESAELQMRSNACQQQAMSLQKEALLRNLNCL
ncbi:restriction endonuclease [Otoolea muris]|uniref:restriction endonuclease n=1 Tax=Otoolea muris TaxID=2941515 RepID=UPI00203B3EFA|nr:restriction endonuclease [Otoolea muris]